MAEKNTSKVGLIIFLMFLLIATIVLMAIYTYIDKEDTLGQIASLKENETKMQEKLEQLQESINEMESKNDLSEENNNENKNRFSDEEVKEAMTNYLNIFAGYGSVDEILVKIGLMKNGEYSNVELTEDNYKKTNIKYSDFENTIAQYMTKECFDEFNGTKESNAKFKDVNGLLYYFDSGLTGMTFVVEDIKLIDSDKYNAKVYHINLDESKEYENLEFGIADNNNRCVISYCK